jgi:hypothetical protein
MHHRLQKRLLWRQSFQSRELAATKVCLSLWGCGDDTLRYWEFPAWARCSWRKLIAIVLLTQQNVVPEFRLLAPVCRQLKKGCLVDVGANLGLYTLLMRENSPLPIIAYEPQPFLCDLIHRSVEQIILRISKCGMSVAAPNTAAQSMVHCRFRS